MSVSITLELTRYGDAVIFALVVMRRLWVGALCATVLAVPAARAEEPERKRRDIIRPEETHGIPPGFHEESRVRWAAIISGGLVTAVGTYLVVAEPMWKVEPHTKYNDGDSTFPMMMVLGVMHLAVGVPLLTYGLIDRREVYVRDQPTELDVSLRTGPNGVTTDLRMTF